MRQCGDPHRSDARRSPDLVDRLPAIADEIQDVVSFGVGRKNRSDDAPVGHALFESPSWDAVPDNARDGLRNKARAQLGTVGSGNHYVDVFVDETDAIWVGVHFGSRGFGHTIASGFLAISQGAQWGARVPEREVLLPLDMPMGQDYWALMTLAGEYAYAGREWVARKVVSILGGREQELVHNHHNFAWREEHDGETVVVVRKGATPAFPGQKGFIGGSMGDDAVIVRGTSGAGHADRGAAARRACTRRCTAPAGSCRARRPRGSATGKPARCCSAAWCRREMMHGWVREKGVVLRGGGLDESPHVYRRLPDVLAAQKDTIEVLHTLRPLIVVMAGDDIRDPYKD